MRAIPRPGSDEFAPFYAGYIATLGEAEAFGVLARQVPRLRHACAPLSEEEALHRYAPGKWSVREVVGHLVDAERVFSYRTFRVSRGDDTPLAGFEENRYVEAGRYHRRALDDLLAELTAARASTLALLRPLEPEEWERRGVANGMPVSARGLAHIIAGHMEHHLRILRERYGLAVPDAMAGK